MPALHGLPSHFETIITAHDAIDDGVASFTSGKVRGHLLQEEKLLNAQREPTCSKKWAALMNQVHSNVSEPETKMCSHCGQTNRTEPYCWEKHGRP